MMKGPDSRENGAERIHGRDELIGILMRHRSELEGFGVRRIGFFGSFVRDEAEEGSDVDIIVEFEDGKATFRNVGGLIDFLENLLNRSVDLLTPAGIESIRQEDVRENIMKEVVYV